MKVVPDSSVIVKWINQDNELRLEKADEILNDVQAGKVELIAPELAKYETGNAILRKGLTIPQAYQSLGTVYSLPIQFVPETEDLANLTYEIAYGSRSDSKPALTYYDASFIALAQQEGAILVTDNPKHQAITPKIKVIPLGEYTISKLVSKKRTRKT